MDILSQKTSILPNSTQRYLDEPKSDFPEEFHQTENSEINIDCSQNESFSTMHANKKSLRAFFYKNTHRQIEKYSSPLVNKIQTPPNLILNVSNNLSDISLHQDENSGWFTRIQEIVEEKKGEVQVHDRREKHSENGRNQDIQPNSPQKNVLKPKNPFQEDHKTASSEIYEMATDDVDMPPIHNISLYSHPHDLLSESTRLALKIREEKAYQKIKEWEVSRVELLNNHRKICALLFKAITERTKASKRSLKGMRKFFYERIKHAKAFAKMSADSSKSEMKFLESNTDDCTSAFSKIFKEFGAHHEKHIEKSKIIAEHIEETIVKGIIDRELEKIKRKIDPLIGEFKIVLKRLMKQDFFAYEVTKELEHQYSKAVKTSKSTTKDLFSKQLAFYKQAYNQTFAEIGLGKYIANLVKETQEFEKSKLESLTRAMKLDVEARNMMYGEDSSNLVLGTLGQINIEEETKKVNALERLLTIEGLNILKLSNVLVSSELNLESLTKYLLNVGFPKIKANPLLLTYHTVSVEVDGKISGTRDTIIGLTVNRNAIIYDHNPEIQGYAIYDKIKFSRLIFKDAPTLSNSVEFMEERKGIEKRKHFKITFKNLKEKRSFIDVFQKFHH